MIDVLDITKTYSIGKTQEFQALKGVSMHVDSGDWVAIIGPSGSGKSTMMHIMGLLDHPTSGIYKLLGREVSTLAPYEMAKLRNELIGFVFQQFLLLPRYSALDNVALPLRYRHCTQKQAHKQAMQSLEQVGLGDLVHHKPSELSGGQQQRVAIARALVGQPKLILADEPTGALDTKTGAMVMQLLQDITGDSALVMITHDEHVADYCQRKVRLRDGLIDVQGGE